MAFDFLADIKKSVTSTATKLVTGVTSAVTKKIDTLYTKMETGAVAAIDNTITGVPKKIVSPTPAGITPPPDASAPAAAPGWLIPGLIALALLLLYSLKKK